MWKDVDQSVGYHIFEVYNHVNKVTQGKRFVIALQCYKDVDNEELTNLNKQEVWEKHQQGKATLKFGVVNHKKDDDIEYIFEDLIDIT